MINDRTAWANHFLGCVSTNRSRVMLPSMIASHSVPCRKIQWDNSQWLHHFCYWLSLFVHPSSLSCYQTDIPGFLGHVLVLWPIRTALPSDFRCWLHNEQQQRSGLCCSHPSSPLGSGHLEGAEVLTDGKGKPAMVHGLWS